MIGIRSIGVHVPVYRLQRDALANAWGTRSLGGEKAVSGNDEDSLTMAVNAAHNCMGRNNENMDVNALLFTSTTSPYKEKQVASTIASALDLPGKSFTADIASSLRGATTSMNLGMSLVKSNLAENVIVTASDCRMGAPQSGLEQRFGDAAAAVMIGNSNPIARIVDSYSIFDEFFDMWRLEGDVFVRSWEERFIVTQGYMRVMKQAVSDFLKKHALSAKDFSKVVFCGPDPRNQVKLVRSLGFDVDTQLQDSLFSVIGVPGTSAPLLMLAAALEEAKAGDTILLAGYGDGCDLFILEVTENIANVRHDNGIRKQLARKIDINYEKYLSWRDLISVELPRRPESQMPSMTCRWREQKRILAFYGVRCRQCGEIQYPPQRVCVGCGAKDDFDDYKFSDRKANVFTFAPDRLTPTKAPPAMTVFVEFDGGGKMLCELTDCEASEVKPGMVVEMSFRKLHEYPELNDYFWKARPVDLQE